MKRKKVVNPGIVVGIPFFLVGLGLLIGGIFAFVFGVRYKETADQVVGIIKEIEPYRDSDGDRHYDVWVEYKYMSEEYVARIGYYSSTMDEGDPIQLYVQADKPGKPKSVMGLNLTGIILIFMGVIFTLCGGSILFADAFKKNKGKKLLANGRKIYAEVTGGRVCYNYTVNGRHPYKMECKYEDVFSGEVFLYSSGYIWEDPDIYIGSQVAVYVNPNNMAEYYVDLDSLQGALGDTGTTVHDFR